MGSSDPEIPTMAEYVPWPLLPFQQLASRSRPDQPAAAAGAAPASLRCKRGRKVKVREEENNVHSHARILKRSLPTCSSCACARIATDQKRVVQYRVTSQS